MVTSVNTNINAMAAIQSLDQISNQMTSTQSAIESGLSINSAADNPAVFTIAQGLRANVNALGAVSANLNTAVATVQAQTQGATAISNALTTLLKTVTQGQGETGAALAATNTTITNALSNINAYANASTINGTNLLATASSFSVVSNVDGSTTNVATTAASTAAGLGLNGLQVTSAGDTVSSASTLTISAAELAGDTVTYTAADGTATTFTYETAPAPGTNQIAIDASGSLGVSLQNAINALNPGAASAGTGGVVTLTGGGSLVGTPTGATTYSTATGGPGSGDAFKFTPTSGTAQTFTFGTAVGDVAVGSTAAQSYQNLAAAMNSAGIAASASATGVLTVGGGTLATTGTVAGTTVSAVPATSGTVSIDMVNNAIAKIGATLSQLGAATIQLQGLEDYTTQLSDSVTTGLGAMVDANLSAESAQLSSLQTKQSLAIQSLTLANQGPSSLLQLFR
jgi:flagellin